jgi:hypothetical protein
MWVFYALTRRRKTNLIAQVIWVAGFTIWYELALSRMKVFFRQAGVNSRILTASRRCGDNGLAAGASSNAPCYRPPSEPARGCAASEAVPPSKP